MLTRAREELTGVVKRRIRCRETILTLAKELKEQNITTVVIIHD